MLINKLSVPGFAVGRLAAAAVDTADEVALLVVALTAELVLVAAGLVVVAAELLETTELDAAVVEEVDELVALALEPQAARSGAAAAAATIVPRAFRARRRLCLTIETSRSPSLIITNSFQGNITVRCIETS
ncbi:MAG: hypothetical protein M1118_09100 [Chloroflexi bacterium]|nr:hypothetical protein [Chloroflexota bacterium]